MNPQQIPPPISWRLDRAHVDQFARYGWHCDSRRCHDPAVIATHRWFESKSVGRVQLAEHFYCEIHGAAFAQRHHIEIQPPPDGPEEDK